jgi:hypothetical protein
MRHILAVIILGAAGLTACNSGTKKETTTDTGQVLPETVPAHQDSTVSVVATVAYKAVKPSDSKTAGVIAGYLKQVLKDDLPSLKKADRKFRYSAYDVNNDGQDEYFVSFQNMYFCGSGGCTFLLLSHDGQMINEFTVSETPVLVQKTITKGYSDLLINSAGQWHNIIFNGTKYPSNPSVEPVYVQTPDPAAPALLPDNGPQYNF